MEGTSNQKLVAKCNIASRSPIPHPLKQHELHWTPYCMRSNVGLTYLLHETPCHCVRRFRRMLYSLLNLLWSKYLIYCKHFSCFCCIGTSGSTRIQSLTSSSNFPALSSRPSNSSNLVFTPSVRINCQNSVSSVSGSTGSEPQLLARRKVAKMLIAVVAMFGICYLPVHLLGILRWLHVYCVIQLQLLYDNILKLVLHND